MSERASSARQQVVTTDPPASDVALLTRLRARDERAFSELVERYYGSMLRLALVFVPRRAIAEEVVQETWVGVLDGLGTFEGRSTLKTWIFRILANRAKTRGVRERRWFPSVTLSEDDETGPAVDPSRFRPIGMWRIRPQWWDDDTPEKLLTNAQAVARLESALAELPATQRAVVVLRDLDGLDPHEVCSVLEISEANQRVLLHRGRSKLRAMLEDFMEGR